MEEVSRTIRTDIPKGLSVDTALGHATRLLHRIRLVAEEELRSVARARELLAPFDPDDVPFLALAFDLGASAVVSRDRAAFDTQSEIKRWELKELAQVVTTYESGALSIVITGSAAEVIIPALEQVLVAVGRALLEALAALATFVTALLAGTAEALSRVPPWVWAIIGGVLVGLLIWAVFDEEFREKMSEGLSKLADFAREVGRAIVAATKAVCKVVYELLVYLWNLVVPIVAVSVLVAGVLFRQIASLLSQIEEGHVPGDPAIT